MILFPGGGEPYAKPPFPGWSEEQHGVSCVEIGEAIKGIRRRKAPGPDGVPGWVLAAVARELSGRIGQIFIDYLRSGQFPMEGGAGGAPAQGG